MHQKQKPLQVHTPWKVAGEQTSVNISFISSVLMYVRLVIYADTEHTVIV